MPFLQKEFPHLAENYRERYKSRAFLPDSYRKRISALMSKLREKYRLGERYAKKPVSGVLAPRELQASLF
jgi:hypothetical protein